MSGEGASVKRVPSHKMAFQRPFSEKVCDPKVRIEGEIPFCHHRKVCSTVHQHGAHLQANKTTALKKFRLEAMTSQGDRGLAIEFSLEACF